MPTSRAVVVGAGVAGLAAAAELASRFSVTVLDRLPVAGGVLGCDAEAVHALERRCADAEVGWMLGTTAVRWRGSRLLVAGPDGIRWLPADQLIYAGGSRPATAAELRIAGPRLAGVLPATVALHFAEAGVLLGRRVVFVGAGDWAHAAAHVIAEHDCEITIVAPAGAAPPRFRHEALFSGWTASTVTGSGRVDSLHVERAGHTHRISCDAVILAESPRPLRNVDGAVIEPCDHVTFAQPIGDVTTHLWAASEAVRAVSQLSESRIEEVTA